MELNYYVSMSLFNLICFCCYGIELNTLRLLLSKSLAASPLLHMLALVHIRTYGELLQAFLPGVIATQSYPF